MRQDEIRKRGLSVWLRAELPVLMRRVAKRDTRPLLKTSNPEATMRGLIDGYPGPAVAQHDGDTITGIERLTA